MMQPNFVIDIVYERQRELIAATKPNHRLNTESWRPARRARRYDTDSEPIQREATQARRRFRRLIPGRA